MHLKFSRIVTGLVCAWFGLIQTAMAEAGSDVFNVVWDSPSADHHGAMPLGNGDIALNTWMTRDGDLQFYISKTDAWDDNARLVKVGKVRVHFEPNPIIRGQRFRQELKLSEGAIQIQTGEPGSSNHTAIEIWVDANHPVIHVTAESSAPIEATASVELWRTNQFELQEIQCSDVSNHPGKPGNKHAPTIIEPDIVLKGQQGRIGWLHHNIKSVGPQILAEVQGLTEYAQTDPLLHRTFGGIVTAAKGERLDDFHLRSPKGLSHRFNVFILTRHPSTPDGWVADMNGTIGEIEAQDFGTRRAAHNQWWAEFWNRSWIRASTDTNVTRSVSSIVPTNHYSVRIGMDQTGGNIFAGEIGRISIFSRPLSDNEVILYSGLDQNQKLRQAPGLLYSGSSQKPIIITNSAQWDLKAGISIEAWVKPKKLGGGGARIADKLTPGMNNGFLFDTYPGNSLRFICGETMLQQNNALPADQWTHVLATADSASGGCRLFVNGKLVAGNSGTVIQNEAAYVSQMYHLQRFITACAGRGAYPIKFNGTLFTVPPGPTEKDPDYRLWGPGYWWQNTRLPYISLCASGDYDLQRPLFKMYADQLLPLAKYRTRHYLGHGGAYYPECIYFWGPVFSETYGWTPFAQRTDKLQESGWHRWEWVGGLELCWMMLDYYEHTQDREFLDRTVLPFTREILTFFDQHYPTNAQGKLVMYPSQSLETWWRCTNAVPELAGCTAVAERMLGLPARLVPVSDRELHQRLLAKLPPIPVREINGKKALAPAEFFADKSNVENPELYPVFPFRLFAFNRPNPDWAITALENRSDRGNAGWRQDDIFMAYLGLTEEARKSVVNRAKSHAQSERFPAFFGPNYDWTPDQDHGGVLMKAFQSMLMQTDGRKIFLFPAWPKDWNVEFKFHAPEQTVVEGVFRDGKVQSLQVTPESPRADVIIAN